MDPIERLFESLSVLVGRRLDRVSVDAELGVQLHFEGGYAYWPNAITNQEEKMIANDLEHGVSAGEELSLLTRQDLEELVVTLRKDIETLESEKDELRVKLEILAEDNV